MRVLITGGAGFIGSHLCDYFIEKGHEVVCMDNLLTGRIENITHLMGNRNFEFVYYDVTNYIFVDGSLDWILHFASPASPNDYLEYPIQTLKVGALGTHKALGLAKAKNARFLLASTSEVYGDPLIHPQSEEYWGNVNPIGPRGVYDEAKRFAEAITYAYHRYHKIDIRIARIFNTFGPRMKADDGRVVPTFINQALKREPITIYGDGSQTRSFCYISDLLEGIYKLIRTNEVTVVNLGSQNEMTVIDFAKLLMRLVNVDCEIVYKELPVDDPHIRQPNISLAKKTLNWEPKVSLEDGLKKTIEYFRNQIKSASLSFEKKGR